MVKDRPNTEEEVELRPNGQRCSIENDQMFKTIFSNKKWPFQIINRYDNELVNLTICLKLQNYIQC